MYIPLSWLKDYVEITIPVEELVKRLTLAGLEVEELRYVGLPFPDGSGREEMEGYLSPHTKISGLSWAPDKIVVGGVLEVMPHPNADRLVLCRLDDGQQEHIVLTGAPNLFPYKGLGLLEKPLKVAYAREGARIFDGHKTNQEWMILKRSKIRGVESYSMACSEKELGISEDHEGIIILDDDASIGTPLVEYMGDAVLDIAISPNIARNTNTLGIAREIAAIIGAPFHPPDYEVPWTGESIEGRVRIEIKVPELNPRFVLGLMEGITIKPSPYWVQRRLRLAAIRPINNIVDATNYAMLAIGEPLHAFDYDVLVERAGGKAPKIITRLAKPGERLMTLDDVDRDLDEFTVLVTDTAGALSIAGVMGGAESEVNENTVNVLLEGAAWDFINIRQTEASQKLTSEASYRFSRGVHPAMAERGVRFCLKMMQQLAGGTIAKGLVDEYPLPPKDPVVEVTPADAERWLGIHLEAWEMAEILKRLEFEVEVKGEHVKAKTPDHRLDIGEGVIGKADLMEEIARIYGYDRIPETQISDTIPPQYGNAKLEREEQIRDLLVRLGLQEVITYRITSEDREGQRFPQDAPKDDRPFLRLANPVTSDRVVMRHSLLASVLEVIERNARIRDRMAIFEVGPVYWVSEGEALPEERDQLVIALTGPREHATWLGADTSPMDFYDLKGLLEVLLDQLKMGERYYLPVEHPSFHPGKSARLILGESPVGVLGELHPLVHERYEFGENPVLAAELDLHSILERIPEAVTMLPVASYPPVLEDLAVVVEEAVAAKDVEDIIRKTGGRVLAGVRLFDLYRGEQIQEGKKSLAYALIYQAPDRTLTDSEVAKVRARIIEQLEKELDAKLRE
ncbi:MAG: phenylalanine--tRNA ligase subunit beta [Chloroflexi bacterium RBG_16_48_8]|nr:MAG: phenylalanine--tRNA ligase subunit beta [Chloroflexi bacterium RBG_16_48_8]